MTTRPLPRARRTASGTDRATDRAAALAREELPTGTVLSYGRRYAPITPAQAAVNRERLAAALRPVRQGGQR